LKISCVLLEIISKGEAQNLLIRSIINIELKGLWQQMKPDPRQEEKESGEDRATG
jgi:hypothetical protein